MFSLAFKHATGAQLPRQEFSGGDDTLAFRILRQLGFSIVPKQLVAELIERFLLQANVGQDLRTSSYPKEYRGLQIKVGFGQGVFSRVPWVAFLAPGEKVSEGIYPVLLYYREAHLLILAFGVSETNRPYRIIDAKYYRQTLGGYFDTEKIHSGNLYQMMSYLVNAQTRGDAHADGMLIYPKVDRELREHYDILGKRIALCTVDLGAPWKSIDQEIRALMR